MTFHRLTIDDREAFQAVSLDAGRRNCNFSFANLIGWQFWFDTELCLLPGAAVLRFNLDGHRAYMVCCGGNPSEALLGALCDDAASAGDSLCLMGLEDGQAEELRRLCPDSVRVEPRRNQYDYIYRRADLASLAGGKLKGKRNHVNKFRLDNPHFEYRPLDPTMFDECRRLEALWRDAREHENPDYGDTIVAEQRVMETVFANWERLGMVGGSVYTAGRMVAFTYGSPVTRDTLDVCVEKADRSVDGAFSIINQQFAAHLPESVVYLNREEDMGLEGLRKAKLSYHPELLLTYNVVECRCR